MIPLQQLQDKLQQGVNFGDIRNFTLSKYDFDEYTDYVANAKIRGLET
jgi:hypothetical protein